MIEKDSPLSEWGTFLRQSGTLPDTEFSSGGSVCVTRDSKSKTTRYRSDPLQWVVLRAGLLSEYGPAEDSLRFYFRVSRMEGPRRAFWHKARA
jgi:hypothetical protein